MDLKDLELLVALAEHRHFARAAKAAHLSQPAFSSRLRRLEEALRLPLVNRGGRFSGFTAEGEVVLAGARRLLADWRATVASVGAKRGSLTGRLALGVVPSALEAVGPLLAPFRARHPAVHVTVASLTSDRIRQGLDEFSLDLGLTYAEGDPGLIERPLYAEGYALIGRPALLAGLAAPVAWEDAAGLPLALLSRGMQFRRIVERGFAAAGVTVEPHVEADTFTCLISTAKAGGLASVTPRLLGATAKAAGLASLALGAIEPAETIALTALARDPLPPAAASLIDCAGEVDWERLSGD